MLDNLPPWTRHLIIVAFASFVGFVGEAILASGGVSALDWAKTLTSAVDSTAVATITVMLIMYVTPLTRQYGLGSASK